MIGDGHDPDEGEGIFDVRNGMVVISDCVAEEGLELPLLQDVSSELGVVETEDPSFRLQKGMTIPPGLNDILKGCAGSWARNMT